MICDLGVKIKDYESSASGNPSLNHGVEIRSEFHRGDIFTPELSVSPLEICRYIKAIKMDACSG